MVTLFRVSGLGEIFYGETITHRIICREVCLSILHTVSPSNCIRLAMLQVSRNLSNIEDPYGKYILNFSDTDTHSLTSRTLVWLGPVTSISESIACNYRGATLLHFAELTAYIQ